MWASQHTNCNESVPVANSQPLRGSGRRLFSKSTATSLVTHSAGASREPGASDALGSA